MLAAAIQLFRPESILSILILYYNMVMVYGYRVHRAPPSVGTYALPQQHSVDVPREHGTGGQDAGVGRGHDGCGNRAQRKERNPVGGQVLHDHGQHHTGLLRGHRPRSVVLCLIPIYTTRDKCNFIFIYFFHRHGDVYTYILTYCKSVQKYTTIYTCVVQRPVRGR